MSRLIDADTLVHDLAEWYVKESPRMSGHGDQAVADMIWEFIRVVNKRPTVDAIPVVHEHWISSEFDGFDRCSNCKAIWDVSLTKKNRFFRHCPKCGARMDEVME